jgi:hypothetical protein
MFIGYVGCVVVLDWFSEVLLVTINVQFQVNAEVCQPAEQVSRQCDPDVFAASKKADEKTDAPASGPELSEKVAVNTQAI